MLSLPSSHICFFKINTRPLVVLTKHILFFIVFYGDFDNNLLLFILIPIYLVYVYSRIVSLNAIFDMNVSYLT